VFPHLGDELLLCVESFTDPEANYSGESGPTWLHPGAFCCVRLRVRVNQAWYGISFGQRGDIYAVGTCVLSATYDWDAIAPLVAQSHAHVVVTARDEGLGRPVRAFELAIDGDDPIIQAARAGVFEGGRVVVEVHIVRQPERVFSVPWSCREVVSGDGWETWRRERMARIWRNYELEERLAYLTGLEHERSEGICALGRLIREQEGQEGLELAAQALIEHGTFDESGRPMLSRFWGLDWD